MNPMSHENTVGEWAAHAPASMRVFHKHGIDFCCGGGQPLQDVCRKKGLQVGDVMEEIRRAHQPADDDEAKLATATPSAIVDHILERFHAGLPEELERLEGMAARVLRVHGHKDAERLTSLYQEVAGLCEELMAHLAKEEQVLFPWIESGNPVPARGPIAVMLSEHDAAGASLERIRTLTNGFRMPEGACATWRALWLGLEEFDVELRRHIHVENNLLFPRVAAR